MFAEDESPLERQRDDQERDDLERVIEQGERERRLVRDAK
jgi:hypothetical protein